MVNGRSNHTIVLAIVSNHLDNDKHDHAARSKWRGKRLKFKQSCWSLRMIFKRLDILEYKEYEAEYWNNRDIQRIDEEEIWDLNIRINRIKIEKIKSEKGDEKEKIAKKEEEEKEEMQILKLWKYFTSFIAFCFLLHDRKYFWVLLHL